MGISVASINSSMRAPIGSRIKSCEPGRAVAGLDCWPERQQRAGHPPNANDARHSPACSSANRAYFPAYWTRFAGTSAFVNALLRTMIERMPLTTSEALRAGVPPPDAVDRTTRC